SNAGATSNPHSRSRSFPEAARSHI
ncbi:uncharacterized protein METZ01_LOCUS440901, partial [marine metagenome]